MHNVEPFTDDAWICTGCGNLFARWPRCEGCEYDPMMKHHTCDVESAQIEGECELDPLFT